MPIYNQEKNGTTVERFSLAPHTHLMALIASNMAWVFVLITAFLSSRYSKDSGNMYVSCLLSLLMILMFVWPFSQSVTLSQDSVQLNGKPNFRLLWSEIQNAEMSEKQDRLVVFAGQDKRITISQLNGNPALRARIIQELKTRSIPIATTKRAAYYETKGSELRKKPSA